MPTDTSEAGLERLICTALTGAPCDPPRPDEVRQQVATYGGSGWICGDPHDYDREFCVDLVQLRAFLLTTQPDAVEALDLGDASFEPLQGNASPTRQKFLACRARSPAAAPSTCCATGSNMVPTTLTSSTARRRPTIRRLSNVTPPAPHGESYPRDQLAAASATTSASSLWRWTSKRGLPQRG